VTLPESERLYETDAYVRDFEAVALAVDGQRVLLSRTAFYPGGGGQPCDKGALIHRGIVRAVSDVRRRDGCIWHTIMGATIPEGAAVLKNVR